MLERNTVRVDFYYDSAPYNIFSAIQAYLPILCIPFIHGLTLSRKIPTSLH